MIFVDRLSLTTCFLVFRLLRKNKKNRRTVQVLDPMKSTVLSWLIKYWMQLFSVEVNEARFAKYINSQLILRITFGSR